MCFAFQAAQQGAPDLLKALGGKSDQCIGAVECRICECICGAELSSADDY